MKSQCQIIRREESPVAPETGLAHQVVQFNPDGWPTCTFRVIGAAQLPRPGPDIPEHPAVQFDQKGNCENFFPAPPAERPAPRLDPILLFPDEQLVNGCEMCWNEIPGAIAQESPQRGWLADTLE